MADEGAMTRKIMLVPVLAGLAVSVAAQAALEFDGLDDRVTLPASGPRLAAPGEGTFMAWIRPSKLGGSLYAEGHWDGPNFIVGLEPAGRVSCCCVASPMAEI